MIKAFPAATSIIRVKEAGQDRQSVEPIEGASESITVEEFFDKHFAGDSKGAVALKGYRYRENVTQQQLAELTGIPQRHISEMENNKRGIGKDNALKLAKALDTDYRLFL